jgi:hypothetical protein
MGQYDTLQMCIKMLTKFYGKNLHKFDQFLQIKVKGQGQNVNVP